MFLICKLTGAFGRKSVMIWQKYWVIQNVRHSGKRGGKTDKKRNKKLRRGRVHSQKTLRLCRWCSCWHWLVLLYFLWVYLLMLLAFYETFRLHIFYFVRNLASLFFFLHFFPLLFYWRPTGYDDEKTRITKLPKN